MGVHRPGPPLTPKPTKPVGEELRHGGHIDVVRELVDGRAGSDYGDFGAPDRWEAYVARVQAAADLHADKS
ncbi:hypothetical protein GCM10009742_43250 [Kribbella karoonensis]|uniref:Uncharacterized protein n=1 Tax=Kribbella karoonensis TaxID=324851 RepID=A0ABP4Q150_9ACTN